MGTSPNVSMTRFPKQGTFLHASVAVCFNYDTSSLIGGVIVRDDVEEPWRTIIRLDDGRFVLATECQWSPGHTREEINAYRRERWSAPHHTED